VKRRKKKGAEEVAKNNIEPDAKRVERDQQQFLELSLTSSTGRCRGWRDEEKKRKRGEGGGMSEPDSLCMRRWAQIAKRVS